jgi:uncharacterized membrane protein
MTEDSGPGRRDEDLPGPERLLTLSDGVVAITITIMPFTSNLLGEYGANPLAVDIFALNLLLASLATTVTLIFGRRQGLLVRPSGPRAVREGQARAAATASVILLSIGLAWVSTSLAKYCWVLIAFVPWAVNRWSARRGVPDAG